MISRRSFLCGCCFVFPASGAVANWPPESHCFEDFSAHDVRPQPEGCSLSLTEFRSIISKASINISLGKDDSDIRYEMHRAKRRVQDYIKVDPEILIYNDESGPNALATASLFADSCSRKGTVLYGNKLIASLRKKYPRNWGKMLTLVTAHEYAHILQFRRPTIASVFRSELHADFLAGWTLKRIDDEGRDFGVSEAFLSQGELKRFLEQLPLGRDAAAATHGKPEARLRAIKAGYAIIADKQDAAFEQGEAYVSSV